MSETRPTVNVRVPKTLIDKMKADGFTENFGYYLEEIYNQKPRKYESGIIVSGCGASHSSVASDPVSIVQDENGYIEERPIRPPCFGHEYESDGFFCERCKDKKECWVKTETGVIPVFIKPLEYRERDKMLDKLERWRSIQQNPLEGWYQETKFIAELRQTKVGE